MVGEFAACYQPSAGSVSERPAVRVVPCFAPAPYDSFQPFQLGHQRLYHPPITRWPSLPSSYFIVNFPLYSSKGFIEEDQGITGRGGRRADTRDHGLSRKLEGKGDG